MNSPVASSKDPAPHEAFMGHFLRAQPILSSYLRTVVPSASDRDDIMQEVSLALWHNFADYDPSRPFIPYAVSFTQRHVARWRRTRAVAARRFSEATEEALAAAFAACEDDLRQHRSVLQMCVDRLNKHGRKLVDLRYRDGLSLENIASQNESTVNAISKALGKIRRLLATCTDRLMAECHE